MDTFFPADFPIGKEGVTLRLKNKGDEMLAKRCEELMSALNESYIGTGDDNNKRQQPTEKTQRSRQGTVD